MRTKKGIVTSAKTQKTVTVAVHSHAFHPIYKKRFRRSKKFLADMGEFEDLAEGDKVVITECRPLSKRKYFRVTEVLVRVPRVGEVEEEKGLEAVLYREKGVGAVQKEEAKEETKEAKEAKDNEDSSTSSDTSSDKES